MPQKTFISYRRDDSRDQAHTIYDALARVLPPEHVFIDIDSIPLGSDFRTILTGWVEKSDILLALIGPTWLDAADPGTGRRRLDNPDDFVRIEISAALARKTRVIPVLLNGAKMPPADALPVDLRELAYRNAETIAPDKVADDIGRMIRRLALDANPNDLLREVAAGNLIRVQAMLDSGLSPNVKNRDGQSLLHLAAQEGSATVVSALLTAGADLEAHDSDGEPALHTAARVNNADAARALLAAGADINARSRHQETALHCAADTDNLGVVQVLLAAGADPNALDMIGLTPLHSAMYVDDLAIAQALLAAGADPNIRSIPENGGLGDTALHIAAKLGKLDHAKILLAGGADPNVRTSARTSDGESETALDFADTPEMIALLQNATGAPRPSPPGFWARLFGR